MLCCFLKLPTEPFIYICTKNDTAFFLLLTASIMYLAIITVLHYTVSEVNVKDPVGKKSLQI